jgi:hypothetical protein
VWNRQRTDRDPVDAQGELFREQDVQRWTSSSQWAISRTVVHQPLISEEQFVRVQAVHTAPIPADGVRRDYVLAGLVYCGVCGRLMDSHWVHERPSYRCRHGRTSAQPGSPSHPKILYVREDHLLACLRSDRHLRRQLAELADPDPNAVAVGLHVNNAIVVCDHDTWAIESDTTRIELAPATASGFATRASLPSKKGR